MDILTALQIFLEHLRFKNYSSKTIKNTKWYLGIFFKYLFKLNVTDIHNISAQIIKDYLTTRYYYINRFSCQNRPKTRNSEILAIKSFFRFLCEKEYLNSDPSKYILYILEPKLILPKDILTKREILRVFSACDTDTILGFRDRVCFEIFYGAGLRRSELANLKTSDIRFKKQIIFIEQAKNKKDRFVPINEICLKYCENYIKYIRPKLINPKFNIPNLILSYSGKAIPPDTFNDLLAPAIKKANLKKKITLHSFRHTFATHLIQSGMPLRYVQELLGHTNLDTTIRYLQLNTKDLQKEYKKFHPRERDI
jgi:site-specific recombinase XerD